MKKPIRILVISLVAIASLPLVIPVFWLFLAPVVVPPLSPFLPKPTGFPSDTKIIINAIDGNRWWYCRNTPSGYFLVAYKTDGSQESAVLKFSERCEDGKRYKFNPTPSLLRPGMIVHLKSADYVSLAVPEYKLGRGECPFRFDRRYIENFQKILKESIQIEDNIVKYKFEKLTKLTQNFESLKLEKGGLRGDTYFCTIKLN